MDIFKLYWKGRKKGVYINAIEEMFDELMIKPKKTPVATYMGLPLYPQIGNPFLNFIRKLVDLGDRVKFGWQYRYIITALSIKLQEYDCSIKYVKDGINIKLRTKKEKDVIAEIVAREV